MRADFARNNANDENIVFSGVVRGVTLRGVEGVAVENDGQLKRDLTSFFYFYLFTIFFVAEQWFDNVFEVTWQAVWKTRSGVWRKQPGLRHGVGGSGRRKWRPT